MFFNKKKADVEPTVAKPSEDTTKVAESSAEAVNDASKTKKEETSKDVPLRAEIISEQVFTVFPSIVNLMSELIKKII